MTKKIPLIYFYFRHNTLILKTKNRNSECHNSVVTIYP